MTDFTPSERKRLNATLPAVGAKWLCCGATVIVGMRGRSIAERGRFFVYPHTCERLGYFKSSAA
jgi:hypothetical protein